MPPVMANSKDGQDHKDKYFEKNRETRNDHPQYGSSNIYFLEVMANVNFFFNRSNVKVKRFSANPTIRSYIFM